MDIDCLMVGEPIPADLCSAEQGSRHCAGCVAATRRCTACQKARGIADAERGLCAKCAENNPKESRSAEAETAVSSLLESFNDDVGKILETVFNPVEARPSRIEHAAPGDPPILSQPDLLYARLCEHALARADAYIVRHVMQVFAIRARLTEEESRRALRKLTKGGYIEVLGDGEIRLLRDHTAIAEIIERRGEEYSVRGNKSRSKNLKKGPKPSKIPVSALQSESRSTQPVVLSEPRASSSVPVPPAEMPVRTQRSKGPTIGEVFGFILNASMMIGEERIARAVVPTIGVRMKLGTQDVIAALEVLEKAGAIERKDGWRVVVLLKEEYEDHTPVITPKTITPSRATPPRTSGSRTPSTRERQERLHLRVVPGGEEASTDDVPEDSSPPPSASVLDEAIERLEATLPALRSMRDEVNAKVAMLELAFSQLKSAKEQVEQTEADTKRALSEAETAMSDLLNTLRRKA